MAIWDRFKKKKEQEAGQTSVAKDLVKPKKDEKKADSKKGKKEEKQKDVAAEHVATAASDQAAATILAPIVTEKSAALSDRGVMVFKVADTANRVQVRNAFRELYNVTPTKVNIINVRGKRVRFGRQRGKRVGMKKAFVTLPKGTRIDIFEGV